MHAWAGQGGANQVPVAGAHEGNFRTRRSKVSQSWATYHLGVRKKIGAAKVDVIESSRLTFGNSEASKTRC